jgi:HAD superfamily hydrolase (TIGR01484 family)
MISNSKPKRLVAIDLDGTLLNSHHELSDRNISTLRNMSNSGILVAIATGRSKASIDKYIRQLELSQAFIPVICYNGAYGLRYDRHEGGYKSTTIFANTLPNELTEQLISFAAFNGLVLQVLNYIAQLYVCLDR